MDSPLYIRLEKKKKRKERGKLDRTRCSLSAKKTFKSLSMTVFLIQNEQIKVSLSRYPVLVVLAPLCTCIISMAQHTSMHLVYHILVLIVGLLHSP